MQLVLLLLTSNLTLTVSGTPAGRYGTESLKRADVLRDSEKYEASFSFKSLQ